MVFLTTQLIGQSNIDQADSANTPLISKEFKPSISLGMGLFYFMGDVNSNNKQAFLVSPLAFNLDVYRKINDYSDLGFSFLTGRLVGNNIGSNYLNFETTINAGSAFYTYNFGHFLNVDNSLLPYVSLGVEFLNFNSKGDLFDANGNRYHYWDDGTIRNIDQNSPQAANATRIQRDYFYETDLRNSDLDGFGKYSQFSLAFPVGLGFTLRITDRMNFRVGSILHLTTSDYIDNVTNESIGDRAGNSANDNFLYHSVSLHYDFLNVAKKVSKEDFEFPDFLVLQTIDSDNDGIIDSFDDCPFTPEGVQVNKRGCPLDEDEDGVWDYMDEDLNTAKGVVVSAKGIEMTEEDYLNRYLRFIDSVDVPIEILQKIATVREKAATYRILLGEFSDQVPPELLKLFMAEEDIIGSLTRENKTAYLAGKYGSIETAQQRVDELLAKGFPIAEIVVWEDNDFIRLNEWKKKADEEIKEIFKEEIEKKENLDGMYTIQLGETPSNASTIEKVKYLKEEEVVVFDTDKKGKSFVVGNYIDSVSASQNLKTVDPDNFPKAKVVKVEEGKVVDKNPDETPATNVQERIAYKEKSNKLKEQLSNLNGAFVIDFGKDKNPKVDEIKEELKKDPEIITVIDPVDNSERFITKTPESIEKIEELVAKKQNLGYSTASIAKVENNQIIRLSEKDVELEKTKIILKDLEGSYVIDFGKANTPEIEKIKEELKKDPTVVTVVDPVDNTERFITKTPETIEKLEEIVSQKQKTGFPTAAIAKVENNTVKRLTTQQVQQEKEKLNKGTLSNLEGAFVIDFGKKTTDQLKSETSKELAAKKELTQIANPTTGEKKLVAVSEESVEELNKKIEQIKTEGDKDVQLAIVQNGKVIPVKVNDKNEYTYVDNDGKTQKIEAPIQKTFEKSETPIEASSKAEIKTLEDKFVIQIGTINKNTPEDVKQKLLSIPNTIRVANKDGYIEILSDEGYSNESDAQAQKTALTKAGFVSAKVAKLDNGTTTVLAKEKLNGKYTISLGSFASNVSNEDIDKILSISDVESIETFNPDLTTYTVGNFDSPEQAKQRMQELAEQGFNPAVVKYENGKMNSISLKTVFSEKELTDFNLSLSSIPTIKTDQIVFRVQLGAYRNKISESVFKGVNTLAFPTQGGITKYVTGSFVTYKQAFLHKNKMRTIGFDDAFVVAYKDGKRIKVTDLVNEEEFVEVKQAVLPAVKEVQKSQVKTKEVASTIQQKPSNGVSYRVQIGAFKDNSMQDKLSQFTDVEMEVYGEYKRFISGNFDNFLDADKHKKYIQSKGFPNAFIVAYNNGERVTAPGENAKVIEQEEMEKTVSATKQKLVIMIQIGLYRGDLPSDVNQRFNNLPNITKQVTPHGVTRYLTGNFSNPSEAAAYKEELIKKGFEAPFLVAYYDNERIDIKKAIEIYQGN